jgi:hypothetical protein
MAEERDDNAVNAARLGFREALLRSHRKHGYYDQLEVAASRYCSLLHNRGCSPERTVVLAKEVIDEAIDDHDRSVAEKAVLICIQQYYRAQGVDAANA